MLFVARNRIWLLVTCGLLGGCAGTPPPARSVVTAGPYCGAVRTICVNKADQLSEPTASKIEGGNLARQQMVKSGKCRPRPEDVCHTPQSNKSNKPTS